MRLELIPLVLGVLVALAGAGLVADAYVPDSETRVTERRRRTRAERNRHGEAALGLGLIALAGALIGLDRWRYGTVAAIAGISLVAIGVAMNASYLREALTFRGAARRGRSSDRPADRPPPG